MGLLGELPKLAEGPVIGLLAIVVVVLAWSLTRVLAFLPRLPNAIVAAMSQSGDAFRQAVDELQETIGQLQDALHEERKRLARKQRPEVGDISSGLDAANAEISQMKQHLASVDQDRKQALQERDEWKQKAINLETLVRSLEEQVEGLRRQVEELNGRAAA